MRIAASVMKGLRIGLSGTSLALALAGCHKAPKDEPISAEAPPATTVEASSYLTQVGGPDRGAQGRRGPEER